MRKPQHITDTFSIDFFELIYLAEACICPGTIGRAMFWDKLVDTHFFALNKEQRMRMFESINRHALFQDGLACGNEHCILFNARFDPSNQFLVKTMYEGNEGEHKAFLLDGKYHTDKSTCISKDFIVEVKQILK